jgi:hypothetical protein
MKKLIAIALFSILGLGLTQGKASAWWEHLCCHHKCCLTLTCRQYNAFSPFCCDGACGFMPLSQGPSCGNGCTYSGDGACLGELPATATPAPGKASVAVPPSYGPMPYGPNGVPADAGQNFANAVPPQNYPQQGYAVQGYPPQGYPVQGYPQGYPQQGYQGYPANGYGAGYPTGVPAYNPNFAGYGAWNGGRR